MCVGPDRVYAFGRRPEYYKWTIPMEFRLYSASKEWRASAADTAAARRALPLPASLHLYSPAQLPVEPTDSPRRVLVVSHGLRGGLGRDTAELERALEYLEEALEIDPGLSLNHFVLAMIHAEMGQDQKARDAVEEVFRIDPKFSSQVFTQSLPFSDPEIQARRDRAIKKAGMS